MTDMADDFKAMREERTKRRAKRRGFEDMQFDDNAEIAAKSGLTFRKCSEGHYQVSGRGLKLNLWPSTFRMEYCGKVTGPPVMHRYWTCRTAIQQCAKMWPQGKEEN